jgi:hypothetical protein
MVAFVNVLPLSSLSNMVWRTVLRRMSGKCNRTSIRGISVRGTVPTAQAGIVSIIDSKFLPSLTQETKILAVENAWFSSKIYLLA